MAERDEERTFVGTTNLDRLAAAPAREPAGEAQPLEMGKAGSLVRERRHELGVRAWVVDARHHIWGRAPRNRVCLHPYMLPS